MAISRHENWPPIVVLPFLRAFPLSAIDSLAPHAAMFPLVVQWAKPGHVQRPEIVAVVAVRFRGAASLTRLPLDKAALDCRAQGSMSPHLKRMGGIPPFLRRWRVATVAGF
ncbi:MULTISPECIES: hypothetical protein [unclassified Mesorhizobium]|uniref:hypothetical protein n=1 Tax=unclassified Mesorhizobium TaxID=325217 RepID=UPI0011278B35|nr:MULTISPECIES: hypothetical protein [unclassified Mesorhizobium]TPJ50628.1 hypothetical protein FJ426_24560 [Mesorhizobium sp. B2-6-4]TPM14020.1 hypothetical protein FJ953_26865 [Mesorhizobium sp. B2-3-6]